MTDWLNFQSLRNHIIRRQDSPKCFDIMRQFMYESTRFCISLIAFLMLQQAF